MIGLASPSRPPIFLKYLLRTLPEFTTLGGMKKSTIRLTKGTITVICIIILYFIGMNKSEDQLTSTNTLAPEESMIVQGSPTDTNQPEQQHPVETDDNEVESTPHLSVPLGELEAPLELPAFGIDDPVYYYNGFTLLYDEEHEQARWVAYELTDEEVFTNVAKRSDNFRPDPQVTTGSATKNDYYKSGYDRGHLAPAGDLGWSAESMSDSFYFTNMSPQDPSFNRGVWKKLEELMRDWAVESGSILIATGPILEDGLPTIGQNGVSIPKQYYKVIIDYQEPLLRGVGFILDNEKSSAPLSSFAVTIDEVEAATGIDFFAALPDLLEEQLESTYNRNDWLY